MKKVQKSMLDKLASVSKFAAVKAAGSISCAGFHQPKEPKALQNPIVSMMKLYELVGLRHGCNAESVEHLIRYAIESAYTKNKMNHYFPEVYGRPSNSMAIRQAAEFVRTSET